MDATKCSACDKVFTSTEQAVNADCGHLVHLFKVNCNEDDFCRHCNRKFHVYSNAPIVDVPNKPSTPSKDDGDTKEESQVIQAIKDLEDNFNKQLETQKEVLEESTKKFQEQRTINLEMIKKLNMLSKSYESLLKLFHEQTEEDKKIVKTLTRIITEELAELRKDVNILKKDVDNILDSYVYQDHYDEEEECEEEEAEEK